MLLSLINSFLNLNRKQFVNLFLNELEEAVENEDIKRILELYETEEDYDVDWFDLDDKTTKRYKKLISKANKVLL